MKKEIRRTGWMLLTYDGLFFWGTMLTTVVFMFIRPSMTQQQFTHLVTESGIPSLVGIFLGFFALLLFRGKNQIVNDLQQEDKRMNLPLFLQFLCCFMAIQMIFSVVSNLFEMLFNLFGYTLSAQIDAATSTSTTFSMFLYGSLLGPIMEELVFRGALLRSLEKYGKTFAIIVSSVMFGIYHGNITQGIFAAAVGLVLSYIALEYSMKWTILLHIINNLVFGDLLDFLTGGFSLETQAIISNVIMMLFFIIGIRILWENRQGILAYRKLFPARKGAYLAAFTSIGILAFIIINMFMAISSIERMK